MFTASNFENCREEGEMVVVTKMMVATVVEMAVKGEDLPSNALTVAGIM